MIFFLFFKFFILYRIFQISNLTENCESDAMKELKDAWDFDTARVRYYIEYHVREPKASDHKGHELQYLVRELKTCIEKHNAYF